MGLSAIELGWVTFSAPNDKNMSLADPHLTLECKTVQQFILRSMSKARFVIKML